MNRGPILFFFFPDKKLLEKHTQKSKLHQQLNQQPATPLPKLHKQLSQQLATP